MRYRRETKAAGSCADYKERPVRIIDDGWYHESRERSDGDTQGGTGSPHAREEDMIYVGVENSTAKVRIATRGPSRTIYVDPADLAWDCHRHVAFLRDAEKHLADSWDEAWMLRSQYAGWMLQGGRSQRTVLVRCRMFLERVADIRTHGLDGPWATVTVDGIRLDGSHRAAIAVI